MKNKQIRCQDYLKREGKNENNACSLFGVDWCIAFDSSHPATKERRNQKTGRQMIDSFDIKFIAFWVIWIIGVGIFGWLISQPRKKKEDK